MNSKQQYYGNIKKRSSKDADGELANLYRESEEKNDVEDFLNNADNVDEEKLKEKPSAKKKRLKKEKHTEQSRKAKKIIKRIVIIIILLGLTGTGIWFFLKSGNSQQEIGGLDSKDAKADEIYYSHLTGLEVSKAEIATQATTCIMIENSPDARPQSGLNDAGVIYEAIAEGGITRFMAIFQESKPNYIGPVRSVRLTLSRWQSHTNVPSRTSAVQTTL